jgi:hypothetical protein
MQRISCFLLASGLVALACAAPNPSPAESPSSPGEVGDEAIEDPAAADADPSADNSEGPAEVPEAAGGGAAAPPKESLFELCTKMCDAVAPKCTPMQLKGCKSTCESYEAHPAACDGVVRTALECARSDKDFLFCANVVPDSCAKQYKNIQTCAETGAPPEDAMGKGLPAGWARTPINGGFSVEAPKGMKAKTVAGIKTWSTAHAGATYQVALRKRPEAAKLDNRAFLKVTNELFGKCAPKIKLHALVERESETSIQFKGACPDGNSRVGRLHVVGSDMYVLEVTFPNGSDAEVDTFIYSFER